MNNKVSGPYSDPNNTPPLLEASVLGLQHVLAMFASNVTPSVIVAGAAGLAFGGETPSPEGETDASTLLYDGSSWTATTSMNLGVIRTGGTGTQPAALNFGGVGAGSYKNQTQEFDLGGPAILTLDGG